MWRCHPLARGAPQVDKGEKKKDGFKGLIQWKHRDVSILGGALLNFPKGALLDRAGSSTFFEVVFICFRFSNDTALEQRFQCLGSIIPQPKPKMLGFRIGQVNCTTGVKGFSSLKILHDKGCCAPYPVGKSVSGQDIDNCQKDDTENDLDKFRHFLLSLIYSDSMRSTGKDH